MFAERYNGKSRAQQNALLSSASATSSITHHPRHRCYYGHYQRSLLRSAFLTVCARIYAHGEIESGHLILFISRWRRAAFERTCGYAEDIDVWFCRSSRAPHGVRAAPLLPPPAVPPAPWTKSSRSAIIVGVMQPDGSVIASIVGARIVSNCICLPIATRVASYSARWWPERCVSHACIRLVRTRAHFYLGDPTAHPSLRRHNRQIPEGRWPCPPKAVLHEFRKMRRKGLSRAYREKKRKVDRCRNRDASISGGSWSGIYYIPGVIHGTRAS